MCVHVLLLCSAPMQASVIRQTTSDYWDQEHSGESTAKWMMPDAKRRPSAFWAVARVNVLYESLVDSFLRRLGRRGIT